MDEIFIRFQRYARMFFIILLKKVWSVSTKSVRLPDWIDASTRMQPMHNCSTPSAPPSILYLKGKTLRFLRMEWQEAVDISPPSNHPPGKTFTMDGTPQEPGIIVRAVSRLLAKKARIFASHMEIYNEKVFDLTSMDRVELFVRQDADGAINVAKLTEVALWLFVFFIQKTEIESEGGFEAFYKRTRQNRSTKMTKLNPRSSRSHSILRITVLFSHSFQLHSRFCLLSGSIHRRHHHTPVSSWQIEFNRPGWLWGQPTNRKWQRSNDRVWKHQQVAVHAVSSHRGALQQRHQHSVSQFKVDASFTGWWTTRACVY